MAADASPALAVRATANGITFEVRLTPRASRTEIAAIAEGVLRVRVTAPPVDDAANETLIALLARALSLPRSAVRLVAGARSRTKRVLVTGITESDLRARLRQALTPR